jgi:hypothetical protein
LKSPELALLASVGLGVGVALYVAIELVRSGRWRGSHWALIAFIVVTPIAIGTFFALQSTIPVSIMSFVLLGTGGLVLVMGKDAIPGRPGLATQIGWLLIIAGAFALVGGLLFALGAF